jgi:hypothetical protein
LGRGLRGQRLRLGRGKPVGSLAFLGRQIDQADDRLALVNDNHRLAVVVLGRRLLPAGELAEIPRLRPGRHRKRRRQLVQRQLAVAVIRLDKSNGEVTDHLVVNRLGSGQQHGIGKTVRYLIVLTVDPLIGSGEGGLSRRGRRINACVAALARLT